MKVLLGAVKGLEPRGRLRIRSFLRFSGGIEKRPVA